MGLVVVGWESGRNGELETDSVGELEKDSVGEEGREPVGEEGRVRWEWKGSWGR